MESARVTVLHQGALGDFLLALPVFEGLYCSRRGIRIDFCSKSDHLALISEKPYAGVLYPVESLDLSPFFHEDLWKEAPVPGIFKSARAAFIFGQERTRLPAKRLAKKIGSPVHWVRSFPGPGEVRPVSRFLIEQIRSLGWPVENTTPRLRPLESERAAVYAWLMERGWIEGKKPVIVHPGSGGWKKTWPLSRWWSLLYWMRKRYPFPVILTLGPADEYLRGFASRAEKLGIYLLEGISIARLASFLAQCRLYIGNDSGISHLAAVLGTPTVTIFGPTLPEIWAPNGANVHVIKSFWKETEILAWNPDGAAQVMEPEVESLLESLLVQDLPFLTLRLTGCPALERGTRNSTNSSSLKSNRIPSS